MVLPETFFLAACIISHTFFLNYTIDATFKPKTKNSVATLDFDIKPWRIVTSDAWRLVGWISSGERNMACVYKIPDRLYICPAASRP